MCWLPYEPCGIEPQPPRISHQTCMKRTFTAQGIELLLPVRPSDVRTGGEPSSSGLSSAAIAKQYHGPICSLGLRG